MKRIMRKLPSSAASHLTAGTFLPAALLTVTHLLASAAVGFAQDPTTPTPPPVPTTTYSSGNATISTANCNAAGGLCQAAPACNNGAGPNPDNIQATVTLCETRLLGTVLTGVPSTGTLRIRGTGRGFQFGKTYVSLLYLNGNTATCSRFPAGVSPTLQNLLLADSDFASMHLGFWVVLPDGQAVLNVDKEATVTGLFNYQTVSVREMQPPNAACYNCGLDPAPQLNALRACGALTVVSATNCSLP
jgi:hypothetical protein